jgi:glucosamine--fructose-6-phosphate aminotransferase (isomerizing)
MIQSKMPRWAQRLLDTHPNAIRPTPDNPVPDWLEAELKVVPLWYHIREATSEPRSAPPYHLIEDVHRQPDLLQEVLHMAPHFAELAERIQREQIEHLIFVGCGSAYYNSLLGAFIFPRLAGMSAEAVEAWEFYNYAAPNGRKTMLIAQSATGASFEVLAAVRRAREGGISTLALTNTLDSPLEELADETVCFPTGQRTGPDIGVVTTRLLMLYLLALDLGRRRKVSEALVERLGEQLDHVPTIARRFLSEQEEAIQVLAQKYHRQSCMLVVGSGPNWFTALEAALKMEEESSTPCRTYQVGDYHHMAISLLAPDRTTVIFALPGPSYERAFTCVRTARAGGSPVVAVVLAEDSQISGEADDVIVVPGQVDELLFPPLGTIVGQLYGYYLGINKGLNPDTLGTDDINHARAWLTSFPLGTH